MTDHPEASCTCASCVNACQTNPGWFAPNDAKRALDAGLANRIMLDWWSDSPEDIFILAPAARGCEGSMAPDMPMSIFFIGSWCKGRCTFLNKKNRCDIHDSGHKPHQCRTFASNETMRDMWNTKKGRALVARWRKETNNAL